jgi:hypothetical protein
MQYETPKEAEHAQDPAVCPDVDARRLYERALGLLHGRVVDAHPHIAALNANLAAVTADADVADTTPPRAPAN